MARMASEWAVVASEVATMAGMAGAAVSTVVA